MVEKIDKFTKSLEILKNFAWHLFIPSALITFFPDDLLKRMRFLEVKNSFGLYITIVFLVTSSICIINIFSIVIEKIRSYILSKKQNDKLYSRLLHLTNTEKIILQEIFINGNANLSYNNASVTKLEALNIIMRPIAGIVGLVFSYTLQPWALVYLQKHPEYFNDIKEDK